MLDSINLFRGLIPYTTGLKIYITIILVSLCAHYVINKVTNRFRGLLILAWLLLFYLFFRVILDNMGSFFSIEEVKLAAFYIPFFLITFIIYLLLLTRLTDFQTKKILSYLNVFFVIVTCIELIKFGLAGIHKQIYIPKTDKIFFTSINKSSKPNIYLLVFDEYAGFESLKTHFNYNNESLKDSLSKRNFFISQNSSSNYNLTLASMLATLEMNYINNYDQKEFNRSSIHGTAAHALYENNLTDFLHNNGYKIINNTFFNLKYSNSNSVALIPLEDRFVLDKTFGRTISKGFLQNIPSNTVQNMLQTHYSKIYRYNERVISTLRSTIQQKINPAFIYSHFLIPHLPYLKDKTGNVRSYAAAYNELKARESPDQYIEYLQYTNQLMLQFTDSILRTDHHSIIILMSDHGYRSGNKKNNIKYHFNNLLAVYTPNRNYSGFTDTTCLVNTFRIILNNNFGQNLSLSECHSFDVADGHIKE